MIEQRLHRGIEPVPITQLEGQALLQVASKDTGGIELLEALQNPLDPVFPATEESRHPVETGANITILVKQIEKMQRDDSVVLVAKVGPDLLEQMLAQGAQSGRGLVEAGTSLRIEASVATVPRLRLAAKIDSPVSILSPFCLPLLRRIGCEFTREHLRYRRRGYVLSAVYLVTLCVFPELPLVALQQRVLLDLAIDEISQLKIRELQHFDRLLQLRRHDQRL